MLKSFILILSHKKSTLRDEQRKYLLNNLDDRFIFYYFIGDKDIKNWYKVDEENNIVYLKVDDNYESLSMKVYYAIKFISENYLEKISGIFKTDDDISLNINKIIKCIDENKLNLYFGKSVISKAYDSIYHYGKCESDIMNKTPIHLPDVEYCAGGGYYISKSVLNNILNSKDIYESIIFEDVCTGLSMNRFGIFPNNVDIKRNGCMWGSFDELVNDDGVYQFVVPNRVVSDNCKCGEPKNRRASNFCQKCNRLY